MRPVLSPWVLVVSLVMVGVLYPVESMGQGQSPFVARTVYQAQRPIYGLAFGEFDSTHPGGEVACLLADASVVQLSPAGSAWPAILRHKGLTPIGGMIDRPTICIGNVHSGFAGNEIVIDGGKNLTAIYPGGNWSYKVLFVLGSAGAGWGSRIGDIDPNHPGAEILHSVEGVMDCGTIGVFRETGGLWQEEIVYSQQVVMDTAVGEFDSANPGVEMVAATEMGLTYEIYPPATGPFDYWPRRTLWDNMDESGWVTKIADIEPGITGNEIVYGTRYSDSITMSYPISTGGHHLEVLFTGSAPPGYSTMYDIAVSDVLPPYGLEILGVDASGSVYMVRRVAQGMWQGTVIWQSMTGPLHAVVAGDLVPQLPGNEILVAGQSGTVTLLTRVISSESDPDGGADLGGQ